MIFSRLTSFFLTILTINLFFQYSGRLFQTTLQSRHAIFPVSKRHHMFVRVMPVRSEFF